MDRDLAIKKLTLALMYLTSWKEKDFGMEMCRTWKGYDFGVLNVLEEEDFIRGSHKSKSAMLTDTGIEEAQKIIRELGIEGE